jgi:acyl carrier protein
MTEAVQEDVRDQVVAIVAEQGVLEPHDVGADASLQDLGIDSLGLVEMIFSIEEAFDIEIPFNSNDPADTKFDISTVGAIVRAVEQLIAAKG